MSADDVRARVRSNMERLGIPQGSDDPTLIALGAPPLSSPDSETVELIADVIADWAGYHSKFVAAKIMEAMNARSDAEVAEAAEWVKSDEGVQAMRASFAEHRRLEAIGRWVVDNDPDEDRSQLTPARYLSAWSFRMCALAAGDPS